MGSNNWCIHAFCSHVGGINMSLPPQPPPLLFCKYPFQCLGGGVGKSTASIVSVPFVHSCLHGNLSLAECVCLSVLASFFFSLMAQISALGHWENKIIVKASWGRSRDGCLGRLVCSVPTAASRPWGWSTAAENPAGLSEPLRGRVSGRCT